MQTQTPIKFATLQLCVVVGDADTAAIGIPEFKDEVSEPVMALVAGAGFPGAKTLIQGRFSRDEAGTVLFYEITHDKKGEICHYGKGFVVQQLYAWTPLSEVINALDMAWINRNSKKVSYRVTTTDGQEFTGVVDYLDLFTPLTKNDILDVIRRDVENRFPECGLRIAEITYDASEVK